MSDAKVRLKDGVGGDSMSEAASHMSLIFDGAAETALLEARRLVRAGEMATGGLHQDDQDNEALAAVFRAIDEKLVILDRWVERLREEALAKDDLGADSAEPAA